MDDIVRAAAVRRRQRLPDGSRPRHGRSPTAAP